MSASIMIQGAGSNVGKSLIVAGLVRAARKRGLSVAPFKPQNMSNNAAVTADGGEIGRAQALQALAAGLQPHTDMNPVLLKPETDTGAQVIVQGKRIATLRARDYGKHKATLLPKVLESYRRLRQQYDLVIVEGAGSPAEVNLRAGDIANMGFADAADIPVILVGDIDRGGVIAQLVGTYTILPAPDRNRITGFMVNKFRGDVSLFDEGREAIIAATGWHDLGVLPWFSDAWKLPAEDILDLKKRPGGALRIAVPRLDRIANFDDLDPLTAQPDVTVEIVEPGQALPGDAQLVLIPGSKSTISDLARFRENGWDIDLLAHVRRGGHVLGICGGYQMLGRRICDPEGIEGHPGETKGLGLLDVITDMTPQKRLSISKGRDLRFNTAITGYEIHIGETNGPDTSRAWLEINHHKEGAASADGRIRGCYVHGLFSSDAFRTAYLRDIGADVVPIAYEKDVEDTLDALAAHIEKWMDVDRILDLATRNQR